MLDWGWQKIPLAVGFEFLDLPAFIPVHPGGRTTEPVDSVVCVITLKSKARPFVGQFKVKTSWAYQKFITDGSMINQ